MNNRMNRQNIEGYFQCIVILISFLFLFKISPLYGQVATGGGYSLDKSFFHGVQQVATAGNQFSLNGSIGEGFSHATGVNQSMDGPMKRLYDGFLEPLKIDPSISNVLTTAGGDVQIMIPGGVIPQPYEPMIGMDPTNSPIATDLSTIQQATQKIVNQLGPSVNAPIAAVEMQILLEDNSLFSEEMANPSQCALAYSARNDGGKVLVFSLDDESNSWTELDLNPTGGFTNVNRVFSAPNTVASISHTRFGVMAVFQQGLTDVDRAYAFPVPWRPNGGNPSLYGTLSQGITFSQIPTVGLIGIYNIAGELVREIVIPPGSIEYKWDGKTGSGNDVVSGVYIWTVEADGNRKTGKMMIIR